MISDHLQWSAPRVFHDWLARLGAAIQSGEPPRPICEDMARRFSPQHISRRGAPYLDRYVLEDLGPKRGRVCLHHFLSGDDGAHHNHPWYECRSVILAGGYVEYRPDADPVTCLPGHPNTIGREAYHRVELIESDAWTLFFTGRPLSPPVWGFLDPATGRHVDFQRWHR